MRDAILFGGQYPGKCADLDRRANGKFDLVPKTGNSDSLLRRLDHSQILEWEARLAGKVVWSEETAGHVDFAVPERGAPFEGFKFRTVTELTVNFIWLYIYSESPAQNIRVAFDVIVVARSDVGPLAALK